MSNDRSSQIEVEELRPAGWFQSHRVRMMGAMLSYGLSLITIALAMVSGYNSQIELRLEERTRELEVAYHTVTSTVAATSELYYAQIAEDTFLSRLMMEANTAQGTELEALNAQLLAYLSDDYEILQRLEFRQLHFHLRDNRSFVRFHRPERFGDDLSAARPTVRATNETLMPSYGFEEGRIYNGFRYVYPLFHEAQHVGSVEVSMNYRAILSRMRASRPVALDFVLSREVMESRVFEEELTNYRSSCLSDALVRETSFELPDTAAVLGLDFTCIGQSDRKPRQLREGLEAYIATTIPFTLQGVPIALSLLPLSNFENEKVGFILGYSRFDEMPVLRRFFILLGLILVALSTAVYVLFLRITLERERVIRIGEDLRRTIQAKDRFFAIVSHDLRGPTGSLASLSLMLKEELENTAGVPHSTTELAEIVAEGAETAFQLLQDLLDWSRSQRGDMAFSPIELPLRTILDTQISVLQRAADEKMIALNNNVGEVRVLADEYMLKTVIRNLLSNGIKFTQEGGSISLSAAQGQDGVTVSVADTGIGMTEQQQAAVFDFSVKVSSKGTRSEPGTGLGLTVCREFVHMHGGTISIESEVGVGTTFHIFLPQENAVV